MSVAKKFTFDLDLGRAPVRNTVLPEGELDRRLAEARREGYEAGLAEGFEKGRTSVEARSAETLARAAESLAEAAVRMAGEIDAHRRQTLEDAVNLSAAIARKLAAHLVARQPEAEMEALIVECLSSLDHAPHLLVRCHPELVEAMRAIAEERIRTAGFSGRLVVLGDPDIALGDGRLEWADGGLVRDINAISNDINTRIAAYLAARGRQGD